MDSAPDKSQPNTPQPTIPPSAGDTPPAKGGGDAAIRLRRNVWFGLAAFMVLIGIWGLIGGWYFGLPLGGEIRSDPFAESEPTLGERIADLVFRNIPHPALARVAIIPQLAEPRYAPRSSLAAKINWSISEVPQRQTVDQAGAAPPPASAKADVGAAQRQLPASGALASPPGGTAALPQQSAVPQQKPPPWFEFHTNLRAANAGDIGPIGAGANAAFCLAILADQTDFPCLRIPADIPQGKAVLLDRSHFVSVKESGSAVLPAVSRGAGGAFDTGSAPADSIGLVQTDFAPDGPTSTYAFTVGTESDDPTAAPAVWIGSYAGAIYKLVLRSGGTVSATAFHAPTSIAVDFVFFVSVQRGYAFTLVADGLEKNANRQVVMETSDGGASWQRLSYRWLPPTWVFAFLLGGVAAFARGTRAHMALRPAVERKFITDHGISDNPIGLGDADVIGLLPIATALSRFIRNAETKPTVAVAVTGPWGSGKTSLMNLVYEDLRDRGISTVWFNAWHNQREENLLAALLAAIRSEAVGPVWTVQGLNYRMRVGVRRILKEPGQSLAMAVLMAIGIFLLWHFYGEALNALNRLTSFFAATLRGSPSETLAQPQPTVTGSIADITLTTGGLTSLVIAVKKILDLFQPLKALPAELLAKVNVTAGTRDLDAQLSFRYRFSKEFATLCEVLRSEPDPGLVIFVDDLDRCEPRQTVDVLEAINFVTTAGQCFVILGFDDSRVKAAIADTYKDMMLQIDNLKNNGKATPEELGAFASRYLEKLVHLIVPVPRSERHTVEKLLGITPLPPVSTTERRQRRRRRAAVDFLSTLILGAVLLATIWFAVGAMTGVASTIPAPVAGSASGPSGAPAPSGGAATAGSAVATSSGGTAPPGTFLTNGQVGELGVLTDSLFGLIPASLLVAGFVVIIGALGLYYLRRLNYANALVTDSDRFKEAVAIWVPAIAEKRVTPRDIKRFVNRLRFLAMRVRDLGTQGENPAESPLDESKLVSFAAIEDLSPASLGVTLGQQLPRAQSRVDRLITDGVKNYASIFQRPLYEDPRALAIYRAIAGLAEESRTEQSEAA